jgi:Bifunctional DNA primase/polymerase, N-terminal/AAA domain/Primase C terminal 1 (PriCT-1)
MKLSDPRSAAIVYIGLGFPVLPIFEMNSRGCACGKPDCASPAKHPRTAHGLKDASTDLHRIPEWWGRWPEANVGIVTGAVSGLVVLDADGPEGLESLTALGVPATTWLSKTARGYHAFFKAPDGQRVDGRVGFMPGLDVRGEGGYVVVPPSIHSSGVRYEWLTAPDQQDLAPLPRTVQTLLSAPHARGNGAAPSGLRVPGVIPAGARNDELFRLARRIRLPGLSRDELLAVLSTINRQRCDPPLSEAEVATIVDKAMTQPNRSDFVAGEKESIKPTLGQAQLVHLSDVEPQAVEWLWEGRIPRGKLTLFIGDPGAGKSTLSLDLVARVTTGGQWPDGVTAPLGNALLLSAEDGIADTLRPRVDQLGGDAERVWVLKAVRGGPGGERLFNIEQDIRALEEVIKEHRIEIVTIDPVSAYLGKVDSFRDSDVRRVLAPLVEMAERTGVAILGILHLTKDSERRAIYRALGSIAFTAAPRAVFAVSKDNDDERRRFFLPVKLNLAPTPPTLAFTMVDGILKWEPEPVAGVDADTVLSAAPGGEDGVERADADEFLRELMALEGVVKANDAFKAARQLGISDRSLKRAKRRLGVKSTHQGRPGSRGWEWFWSLPETKSATASAAPPDTPEDVAPYSGETTGNDDRLGTSQYGARSPSVAPYGGTLRKRRRVIPLHVIPE